MSVVVCTLDEEAVIARCLASVAWADEVIVVDSGSTDRTRSIATDAGARVVEQAWLGFSRQKNHGAALAAHPWVLSLDADEVVSPELAASIRSALASRPDPRGGFAVDRRHDFLGVLLPNNARRSKRASLVRLYHRDHSGWDESAVVHEVVRCPGAAHPLAGTLLQWNDYDLDHLVGLFNRYATVEAAALRVRGRRASALSTVTWPILRFLWHYVARGEFRLGGRGLVHAGLKASSDFVRFAKLWEADLAPVPHPAALDQERDARPAAQPHR